MKYFFFPILLLYLAGCTTQTNPVRYETVKSNIDFNTYNWNSLNFPNNDIAGKYSNIVLHIFVNSFNDI